MTGSFGLPESTGTVEVHSTYSGRGVGVGVGVGVVVSEPSPGPQPDKARSVDAARKTAIPLCMSHLFQGFQSAVLSRCRLYIQPDLPWLLARFSRLGHTRSNGQPLPAEPTSSHRAIGRRLTTRGCLRLHCAKYPSMSRITCVGFVTKTLIAPSVPAGTIAAFATTLPSNEFRVETSGCACPVGHVLR